MEENEVFEFDSFEYFNLLYKDAGINGIYRCSGLTNLEEVLQSIRDLKSPILVVEDSGDGFLNYKDGNFDTSYHTISVMAKAELGNAASRRKAMQICKKAGKKLFLKMTDDFDMSNRDGYNFEFSRIDYSKIGPLATNFYGYTFSFVIEEDFYLE